MTSPRAVDRGHGGRLLLAILLAAALLFVVCGPALAAESPSPSAGTTSLHIGWVQEPDNLNPFIGIQGTDYMLWHLNYDFLVGFDAKTLEPRPELATSWEVSPDGMVWTFTIRSDSTWQRRRPRDRQGCRLHVQLHQREPAAEPERLHRRHHQGRGRRRHAREAVHLRAQGEHAPDGRADPAGARLEQGERQGGHDLLPEQAADRRRRPLPDRRVAEGQVRAPRGQQELLGRRAEDRRAHLRSSTPTRTRWRRT